MSDGYNYGRKNCNCDSCAEMREQGHLVGPNLKGATPQSEQRCENCRFFVETKWMLGKRLEKMSYYCRIRAVTKDDFPKTVSGQWCGEWEQKGKP